MRKILEALLKRREKAASRKCDRYKSLPSTSSRAAGYGMPREFAKASAVFLLAAIGLAPGITQAQNRPNAIHLEALGTGLMVSAHYERMLTEQFAVRAGLGFFFAVVEAGTTFPLMATWLIGEGRNQFEIGAGITIVDLHSVFDDDDDALLGIEDDVVVGAGYLGYRFHGEGGFIFRLGFTPLITDDGLKAYGGTSIGFHF